MNNEHLNFIIQNFQITLQAALPTGKILPYLPTEKPQGRVIVIGAGKAAASMAHELENVWPYDDVPLSGLVITRYQHAVPTQWIEVIEASHPVPDHQGQQAAKRILEMVSDLNQNDLVIALISGGGSALMSLPIEGLALADKQAINVALLNSGAPIEKMNIIRKHFSAIKGGRLAKAAYPASVLTLAISDVVGNDLSSIGSGPTVADSSTWKDVLSIIHDYQIKLPESVQKLITQKISENDETPKQLNNSQAKVIITPDLAFKSAIQHAKQQDIDVVYLGDQISGESAEVAKVFAGIAKHFKKQVQQNNRPMLLLSGGETTVSLSSSNEGKGGRNSEFLLALLTELSAEDNIYALAADTDGIDGSEDNAGAWITPETFRKIKDLQIDIKQHLKNHQAYTCFAKFSQLITTGPTKTNINDYRAILIVA